MGARVLCAAILVLFLSAVTNGATAWNEGVNGDLSENQAAPSLVSLVNGSNTVTGSLRPTPATDGQDWLAITIPSLLSLSQLTNTAYVGDGNMFTGMQNGSSFVGSPGVASSYNGYTHINAGTIGTNVLPGMGTAAGAVGFTPPLGPGTYTFLFQQTGSTATSYGFDFVVVPEPASFTMLILSGAALFGNRRRGMLTR
jgi:hypothetical protein